jgi:hypothetical protein
MRKKRVAALLCHPECNEGSHKPRRIYYASPGREVPRFCSE